MPDQSSYLTRLTPRDERAYQLWFAQTKEALGRDLDPDDPTYDMRGFWQGLQTGDQAATTAINPNDKRLHFPDKWKTPYHKGFSADSQYATLDAPKWNEIDQLVDKHGRILLDERAGPKNAVSPPRQPF